MKAIVTRGVDEVGLDASFVVTDAVQFMRALDEGRWAEGLKHYGGDFLRGFHIQGAPAFDSWVQDERDFLRNVAASGAWALARDQVRQGKLEEGERTAKRALGMVCPDEITVEGFMELLMASGFRVAALRLFERYSAVLKESLDLLPSTGLRALDKRLRTQEGGGLEGPG